ncbi:MULTISPECIES: hypothetical protein [unclassified Flavobacterium]|uniref:hypothetical protein n=1 Tax=unclassified Flavobacterium TaxID=196869 RepID=UPI001F132950|nr:MULTISPECIES: hypothetical protein [unclassified Flavobacterium]UMY65215.1 hypothetical protein MKO97_11980 [Flavobacterium sp. HJ-32-4]
MKTKTIFLMLMGFLSFGMLHAQDRTTVTATSSDISDNLDLKAVASIFGDSRDLEDFERRLNDPKIQISNLDLNNDGYVDYLRVIETTEKNLHLIVVQSVLEKDVFQDVATINVERDGDRVSVQVVGDVYMYGPNYIYEPVYVVRPVIFGVFWDPYYRPYYSPWYWGYYPTYYTYWSPYPIYRYRRNIYGHINVHNHYNYVNVCNPRAYRLYDGRRQNGFERQNPGRSFSQRTQVDNKRDYDLVRQDTRGGTRGGTRAVSGSGTRANTTPVRGTSTGTRQGGSLQNGRTAETGTRFTGGTRQTTQPNRAQSGSLEGTPTRPSTGTTNGRTAETGTRFNGGTRPTAQPGRAQSQSGSFQSGSTSQSSTVRVTPQRDRSNSLETPRTTSAPTRATTPSRSFTPAPSSGSTEPAVRTAPQRSSGSARQENSSRRGGNEGRGRS